LQVELGDNAKYVVKGVGTTSFQPKTRKPLKMSEVLYVLGLKKNLVSISAMEDKGYAVAFVDGKVLAWPKGLSLDSTEVIGTCEGSLYKLNGQPNHALVHDNDNLCEIWHRILGNLQKQKFPILRNMVIGLPKFGTKHQGVCRGCALGKKAKSYFPSNDSRSKEILDLVHQMCVDRCQFHL